MNDTSSQPINQPTATVTRSPSSALSVASGIFLSRIVGLVRDRIFAHYFGNSDAADAFRAAFRIPNFLQNLFGEGVLSASFIPIYARLRAEDRHEEASQLAESIFAILLVITSLLVLLGVLSAPWLVDVIASGLPWGKTCPGRSVGPVVLPWSGPSCPIRMVSGGSEQP